MKKQRQDEKNDTFRKHPLPSGISFDLHLHVAGGNQARSF